MMTDIRPKLRFESDCGDNDIASLRLVSVQGTVALSEAYTLELSLISTADQGLSIDAIHAGLSKPCRVWIDEQSIGGGLTELSLEPTVDATQVTYRALFRPRLSRTERAVRSRVFQDQSALDVVCSVLTEHDVPFENICTAAYPQREYIAQYQEPDFAFLSRLLEHWGIFYWFSQDENGETMVLADNNAAFAQSESYPTLTFDTRSEREPSLGAIGPIRRVHRPQSSRITVRDYNWRAPYFQGDDHGARRQLQILSSAPIDRATGYGEVILYGDHVKDEAEAEMMARIRSEEIATEREWFEAKFSAPGLWPGQRFEAVGTPIADLEQSYIPTRVSFLVDDSVSPMRVQQSFMGLAADVPFRPARRTPKPKISGFTHAIVDGEVVGTAAPIDELGRYRVVMAYDRNAEPGGRASRWVRMAQPSAGEHYGVHFPLHIGTEVAILHLDGDPDRPVIVGALPNVNAVSPVTRDDATKSRIRTRGNILFEFDDDA